MRIDHVLLAHDALAGAGLQMPPKSRPNQLVDALLLELEACKCLRSVDLAISLMRSFSNSKSMRPAWRCMSSLEWNRLCQTVDLLLLGVYVAEAQASEDVEELNVVNKRGRAPTHPPPGTARSLRGVVVLTAPWNEDLVGRGEKRKFLGHCAWLTTPGQHVRQLVGHSQGVLGDDKDEAEDAELYRDLLSDDLQLGAPRPTTGSQRPAAPGKTMAPSQWWSSASKRRSRLAQMQLHLLWSPVVQT